MPDNQLINIPPDNLSENQPNLTPLSGAKIFESDYGNCSAGGQLNSTVSTLTVVDKTLQKNPEISSFLPVFLTSSLQGSKSFHEKFKYFSQCCGSRSAWIQEKVKDHINKTVKSRLFVVVL